MADGATTNLALVLPEVGASADSWGTKTNSNWTVVDTAIGAIQNAGGGSGGSKNHINGNLTVTGDIIDNGTVYAGHSTNASLFIGLVNGVPQLALSQTYSISAANPHLSFNIQPSGPVATLDAAGNFQITGAGFQPGGGSWSAASDLRIKDVLGSYYRGLSAIMNLRPARYRYRNNHTVNGITPAPTEREYVGLIAQEIEHGWPELVTRVAGTIDGQSVTDLRQIDPSELTYALINAVRELATRVKDLEARLA